METELPVETALPESPGIAPVENQSAGNLGDLAAELGAKHGAASAPGGPPVISGQPAKRGRPIVNGKYSKANGSDGKRPAKPGQPPVAISPVENPISSGPDPLGAPEVDNPLSVRTLVPAEMQGELVKETLGFLEDAVSNHISGNAKIIGFTDAESAPYLAKCKMGEKRKDLAGRLTPLVLQEHGIDQELSPTAALTVLFLPWVVQSGKAMMDFTRLAKEKVAMNAK